MKSSVAKISSLPLMLIFTAAGFLVLAASVVMMTVESLISSLMQTTSARKAESWKKSFVKSELASTDPQLCSRS